VEIGQLDRQLKAISTASPVCQALMSIPGVGVQTSAAFAAAVDDASRLKRSRTDSAYFGLVPQRHQSGELDWTGRITKQGDSTVRKLLYEAANSILTRTRAPGHQAELRAEDVCAQDRKAARSQGRARPPPRCHHACHAARWHYVRGLRYGRTSSPAVMLSS
jgi:transposase